MDKLLICIAGVAVATFLVLSIIAGFEAADRRRNRLDCFHYRPRKQLMTGTARQCFQLLNAIFGQKFYVIPDVALSALLSHKVGRQNRTEALGYIEHQIADFVLCNQQTLRPVCVIQLDLANKSKKSSSNPQEMAQFFRSAHLPFVCLTDSKKLNRENIIEEFSRVIYETSLGEQNGRRTKVKHFTAEE